METTNHPLPVNKTTIIKQVYYECVVEKIMAKYVPEFDFDNKCLKSLIY